MLMENNKNNLFAYHIILSVLAILIVVIGIADLYLALNPREKVSNENNSAVVILDDDDKQNKKNYMELTKEEALDVFKKMQEPGYIPEGYISEAVIPTSNCEPMNGLAFSYTNIDDIKNLYNDGSVFRMADLQNIEVVDNYYAVAFSFPFEYGASWSDDGVASGCSRTFAFNKKYYDYSEDTFPLGVFIDTSTDFVKLALPVLATSSGEAARLDTIYSYDFDEDSDGITLNIHLIGLGYDTDYSDLKVYEEQKKSGTSTQALLFSTLRYHYDNSTKQADWVRDCEGCIFGIKVDRSIPLDASEIDDLMEFLQNI